MASPKDETYGEEEAQRRFIAALKAAVNTPPKPMKKPVGKVSAVSGKKGVARVNRKTR